MTEHSNIWRLPWKFVWMLPLAAMWVCFWGHLILHLILKLPLAAIVSPCLAFTGITLALGPLMLWALKYAASHNRDSRAILAVLAGYFLAFDLLCAHYTRATGLLSSRDAFRTSVYGLVPFCLAVLIIIVRKYRVRGPTSPP